MIRHILLFFFLLMFVLVSLGQAQTLISKLPADGTWATYRMDVETKTQDGELNELSGTLTIRVVGTLSNDDEVLRWIEIEQLFQLSGIDAKRVQSDNVKIIDKILVAEDDIGVNKDPVAKLRKMWRYHSQGHSEGDPVVPKKVEPGSNGAKTLHTFLPAPTKKTQPVKEKRLATADGVLICTGMAGMYLVTQSGGFESKRFTTAYSNDDAPFGTVLLKSISKVSRGEQPLSSSIMTITLESKGMDAFSVFPDHD